MVPIGARWILVVLRVDVPAIIAPFLAMSSPCAIVDYVTTHMERNQMKCSQKEIPLQRQNTGANLTQQENYPEFHQKYFMTK